MPELRGLRPHPAPAPFDAVILAGGGATRLGGIDKTAELVGGRSLLERVVAAVAAAEKVIVAGARSVLSPRVIPVLEDRPGGGPAYGLAAALPHVTADRLILVAADLPFLSAAAVGALVTDLADADAVVGVDEEGRDQFLLAAWNARALRRVVATVGDGYGRSLRDLYGRVDLRRHVLTGSPPPWWDCDTAEALATARTWSEGEALDDPR